MNQLQVEVENYDEGTLVVRTYNYEVPAELLVDHIKQYLENNNMQGYIEAQITSNLGYTGSASRVLAFPIFSKKDKFLGYVEIKGFIRF